ncbi:pitrilysin family protein [Proteiniborus sp.]|uniref:M16 family metallopeptidase n=1 Tax=Proteiniborus sp. TaxID=2079015 RepID=UPI003329FDF9
MYNKVTLDNGLRIVTEHIPYVKSVSIGIWVEAGSRKESEKNNGVSHFIEHMLFKGTMNRSAKEIAEAIDNIGGQINAFTSKECTCYYVKVLDNHIDIAIDVLSDMLFNSLFDKEDIIKEKSVICEEIKMYEDSPEDLVHDLLSQTIFDGNSLSYPILGSEETLNKITRDDLIDYYEAFYTPSNTVISIAGNFDFRDTIDMIKKYFGKWTPKLDIITKYDKPTIHHDISKKRKDIEQLHFCLGTEGSPQGQDDLYALLILNNILGGSMSSRLFQDIREDRGLVYSIYSYPSSYKDIGIFTIYAALNPNYFVEVIDIIMENINNIKQHYLSDEEIYKSKEQLKGNYLLGLESTSSRMTSIGKSELLLGKIVSPQEIVSKIDSVRLKDIVNVVDRIFDNNKFNIAYVGKFNNEKELDIELKRLLFK